MKEEEAKADEENGMVEEKLEEMESESLHIDGEFESI